MLSSFFKKNKQNQNLALLIDVGSASVGAALVELHQSAAPNILVTSREAITLQEKLSSVQLVRAMNLSLERVLKVCQAKTKTAGVPSYIFCSLSSPWFILKSRHLILQKQESFEINLGLLDKLLDDEIDKIKDELKETLPPQDVRVIDKKIIQTKLNGYEIKNPYGQKAARLEVIMTAGISSKQATERIEHTIANFFHAQETHFSAFPVAAYNAIRDIFPTEKTFLFLDITGEGTDISFVNNNILIDTVTFPRGKNFFIREISSQFRIPHEVALSILNMFLGGTLDVKRQKEVETLMARIESDWYARFKKTVALLGVAESLPKKLFFMADSDMSALFENILKKMHETSESKGNCDVQYLDSSILSKFVSFESGVTWDPFLTTEALLAAKVVPQFKNK